MNCVISPSEYSSTEYRSLQTPLGICGVHFFLLQQPQDYSRLFVDDCGEMEIMQISSTKSNRCLPHGSSLKRPPHDNQNVPPNDRSIKVARRKISANRTFPQGCGRFAKRLTQDECIEGTIKLDISTSTTILEPLQQGKASKEHLYTSYPSYNQVCGHSFSGRNITLYEEECLETPAATNETNLGINNPIEEYNSDMVIKDNIEAKGACDMETAHGNVTDTSLSKRASLLPDAALQSSVIEDQQNYVANPSREEEKVTTRPSKDRATPNCLRQHEKQILVLEGVSFMSGVGKDNTKKMRNDNHQPQRKEKYAKSCSLVQDLRRTASDVPLEITNSSVYTEEVVTREKVRDTLHLFQSCCEELLQGELKSNGQSGSSSHIHFKACMLLKKKEKWVNAGKKILGNVPGVEIGDQFRYRVELAIVGLHGPFTAGIDYIKQGGQILASSIVSSGRYSDEVDNSDLLIYSGHGGNPSAGAKKVEDQKLERGNLALKNSVDAQNPVRVIRGFKEKAPSYSKNVKSKVVTTYAYDGLYLVEKYWTERGKHGCSVFKFQLRRIPGQPEFAIQFNRKSKNSVARDGPCMRDISSGQEKQPICVVNTIDNEEPLYFKYTARLIQPTNYVPTPPLGCDCTNGCSDDGNCVCIIKNGGEVPYNDDGAIVVNRPLVYECGPSCNCPPSCSNRVSQQGIKLPLQVFKTKSRGWGVRCLTSISSGSFICEYTGKVLDDLEANKKTDNDDYLFDIGRNCINQSLWEGRSSLMPALQNELDEETIEGMGFTIDAAEHGNVGRFINHSCSPNLYAQNVLYDHDDKRLPHIMLFALENIPPLQELTYDYNYTVDQVRDSSGKIKKKACYCGAPECEGRLY